MGFYGKFISVSTMVKFGSKGKGKGSAMADLVSKLGAVLKGMSKGRQGKGKGKRFSAPKLDSEFWTNKVEDENREAVGSDTFSGEILMYNRRQGWGLVVPDDVNALPKKVKAKLQKAAKELKEAGKDINDKNKNAIYFRKPDVNHEEGFKLMEGTNCTFECY